ncbi:hypothetical protein BC938DRAFT_475432 [Jimgerdemannia flammicorona]|uniref:Uncharacterized protein n=1 Tax=Jimgerdemannia flammicorona TaxID=994334 RepID=A0A433PUV5_9FUNG|nr:hypothetical protein BC938DRAFT_475432 [Jimgerdemannia flammicorona]
MYVLGTGRNTTAFSCDQSPTGQFLSVWVRCVGGAQTGCRRAVAAAEYWVLVCELLGAGAEESGYSIVCGQPCQCDC